MQPLSENSINVPAFLSKLWNMVNDPATDHLISWGPAGNSFIIQNQAQFWYELLPVYYKHNNMSSFVRQLNMYGFHKMSTIENGTMDIDKDEIKFFHPYFQKERPELMKHIKRKVTASKTTLVPESTASLKTDDITKVLSEVKHMKGRQNSVDNQLAAMKQENAVLWRELALLRQKHLKQQQIVNKLIQFLVTIVQPATRMGGLGVKRHMPLMIHERPQKKMKASKPPSSTNSDGPIIHELDNADVLQEELLAEADTHVQEIDGDIEELLSDSEVPEDPNQQPTDVQKIFLNPATQDTLLSNLMNGSYNSSTIKDVKGTGPTIKKDKEKEDTQGQSKEDMTVATCDILQARKIDDLDLHVENTQNELNQLKDLLNGCTSLDANALLGLFNDEAPPYGLSYNNGQSEDVSKNDCLLPGSELITYNSPIDFSQLFDDSSEEFLQTDFLQASNLDSQGSITTPVVKTEEPSFPTSSRTRK